MAITDTGPGTTNLVIEPATRAIGAWVSGIDLRVPQPEAVRARLEHALHEHGVLFFHDQPIDDLQHKALARMFGEIEASPVENEEDPEVLRLDSSAGGGYATAARWHTDVSFVERPSVVTALRCELLPPVGCDTIWASMYAAYEALSPGLREMLGGLEAVHTNQPVIDAHENYRAGLITSTHPVVITDPVTGRRALYVNSLYTERLVGVPRAESDAILRFLFEHVKTPRFHVRLRWQPHTVAVWAEFVTQHIAIVDPDEHVVRRRVSTLGDPPA